MFIQTRACVCACVHVCCVVLCVLKGVSVSRCMCVSGGCPVGAVYMNVYNTRELALNRMCVSVFPVQSLIKHTRILAACKDFGVCITVG